MIEAILFYLVALIAVVGAIGVATARSIIRAAVCLLFTLISVAGVFGMLDAEFLAAAQLIIFVGGVLVLIIFGVMLTARQPHSTYAITRGQIIVALLIGGSFTAVLIAAIATAHLPSQPLVPDGYMAERFGQSLLGEHVLPFELLSVLLLVVMIGAAYLARTRSVRHRKLDA